MKLSPVLKDEFYRPLVTILLPGALATFPYVLLLNNYFPEVERYRAQQDFVYYALLFLAVLGVGLILEDIGARIESGWDKLLIRKNQECADLEETWWKYLALTYDKEPIGQGYLRSILLRMKFELSGGVAMLVCAAGLAWLWCEGWYVGTRLLVGASLSLLALAFYLFWESYRGAALLARVRRVLVQNAGPH